MGILVIEIDCRWNSLVFMKLEHVFIITGCNDIHQREHWLVVNQPVLPLMDITTATDDDDNML